MWSDLDCKFLEGKGHISYLFCFASSILPCLVASLQMVSNDSHLPGIQAPV